MAFILVFFFFQTQITVNEKKTRKDWNLFRQKGETKPTAGGRNAIATLMNGFDFIWQCKCKERGESLPRKNKKRFSIFSSARYTNAGENRRQDISFIEIAWRPFALFPSLCRYTRRAVDWVRRSTRCPSRVRVKPNRKWNANHLLCTIPVCVCVSVHCQTFFGGDHGGDPWTGFLRINKLPTSVDTFPNFSRVYMQRWKTWERGSFR